MNRSPCLQKKSLLEPSPVSEEAQSRYVILTRGCVTSTNGELDSGFCLSTASPFYFLKTPHAPAAATLAWVTRHQHHSPDRYLRHQRGTYSDTSQSPKVVVLLRVLSGCRTFYGFEQKDDDTCLSLHRRECFPCSIRLCSRASLVDFYRYWS